MLHKTAETEITAHYEKIKSYCYIWGKKNNITVTVNVKMCL